MHFRGGTMPKSLKLWNSRTWKQMAWYVLTVLTGSAYTILTALCHQLASPTNIKLVYSAILVVNEAMNQHEIYVELYTWLAIYGWYQYIFYIFLHSRILILAMLSLQGNQDNGKHWALLTVSCQQIAFVASTTVQPCYNQQWYNKSLGSVLFHWWPYLYDKPNKATLHALSAMAK